jgi:hypothetical protein
MTRLAIWLFAFSPVLVALIPAARDRWGVALPFFACFTVAVGIALELIVMKRRGVVGATSTSSGNWFAKAFGILFAVAGVVVLWVGLRNCAAI